MTHGARRAPSRLVLLGHPLGHTLSPLIHNAALASAGLRATYSALDVLPAALDAALDALVAENAAGNVTIPHKRAVHARCARVSDVAARAEAVNTWWCEDGAIVGHNTDVGGFDASARWLLRREPTGQRVAIVGAGGAASGVLTAVEAWRDVTVALWSRTRDRAEALASRFPIARVVDRVEHVVADATLVVNATPLGLREGDAHPVALDVLRADAAVLDLVYRRGETQWVRAARARGHAACDGLPMLVEQAALAQERWFDRPSDREAMWRAVGGRPAWMGVQP